MTSHNNGARLRAGLAAVAAATALLATAWGAAPADAAPAPHSGADAGGDLYWSNTTASGNSMIGRARLDGTQVNQQFITGAAFPQTGLAIDSRYIYWVNNTAGTIGRARLDGTEVNQQFITVPDADILLGVAVDPGPHD
jgi:virginiamycin B lyase